MGCGVQNLTQQLPVICDRHTEVPVAKRRASKGERPVQAAVCASGSAAVVVLRGPRYARPPQDDGVGETDLAGLGRGSALHAGPDLLLAEHEQAALDV